MCIRDRAKTKAEIMEKVALSRELGKELDIIVEDFRELLEMIQAFELKKPTLLEEKREGDKSEAVDRSVSGLVYKAPLMLKTFKKFMI